MVDQAKSPEKLVGSFRVLRTLATGGTSDILLAQSAGPMGFERTVVLKCLDERFRADSELAKMFATEATAYARLSDPSIVKLYDFFSHDGRLVMVLEYVDGLTLRRLRTGTEDLGVALSDRAILYVVSRIFAALACAHGTTDSAGGASPIVHRDVNPSNVLVSWDGEVKLADFGVARVTGLHANTVAGSMKGTLGYMAPEQVKGSEISPATDVYGAGVVLWEMLTKRRAFARDSGTDLDVLQAMAEPKIASLDELRLDLDRPLRELVNGMLEPSAAKRTVTAAAIRATLAELDPEGLGRAELVDVLRLVRDKKLRNATAPTAPTASTASRPVPRSAWADGPAPSAPATSASKRPPLKRRPSGLGAGVLSPMAPPTSASNASTHSELPKADHASSHTQAVEEPRKAQAHAKDAPPAPPSIPQIRERPSPVAPSIAPPPELEIADNGLYVPTSESAPREEESLEVLRLRRLELAQRLAHKPNRSPWRVVSWLALGAGAVAAAALVLHQVFTVESKAMTETPVTTGASTAAPLQTLPERTTSVTTTPLVTLFEATSSKREPVIVEGVLIGETPLRVEIPCGTRAIQVGENPVRTLDLPCGKVFPVHEK